MLGTFGVQVPLPIATPAKAGTLAGTPGMLRPLPLLKRGEAHGCCPKDTKGFMWAFP